jgi:Domain of unknown function (DUF397)
VDADLSRAAWHKSTFSNGNGGDCVEHAKLPDGSRAIRHSKHPDGPSLIFTATEWDAFIFGVKAGEFD